MLNKCVFIGRLARDPDLRYTSNGTAVTNFTLAVERTYQNRDGNRDVDFLKIVTWRKLAEASAHNLNKGRLVAVAGRLQLRENESNGRNYLNPEIVASEVKYLDSPDCNEERKVDSNKGRRNENNFQESYENNQEADFKEFDDEDIEVSF